MPGWEVSIQVDQFEDQFLTDSHEPLGIPFDEETNFFHPEEVQDEEFPAAQQVEESIYTDDPVRVYLREMGAVPAADSRGRSQSGAAHGAWQAADAEIDQPFRAGPVTRS